MTQPLLASEQPQLQDRFRGVLLGSAIGDALGAPLEFQPARDPNHYVTDMIGGGVAAAGSRRMDGRHANDAVRRRQPAGKAGVRSR